MKNILFAASECVPFIKTGGLADVVGALPQYLDKNEFDEYLREPGKQMSLVEVNADENIIRINEDMQSEWICREYPLDLLVAEGKLQYLNNLQKFYLILQLLLLSSNYNN